MKSKNKTFPTKEMLLVACPFCGGAAVPDFIEGASYVIKCSACSTRSAHLASASIAIAAWNRRAVMATPPVAVLAAADYAAIIKRYEDTGDQVNADVIRQQMEVASTSLPMPMPVRTWRERINVAADYPLHMPTDVERARVAEIAELRARFALQMDQNAYAGVAIRNGA